MRWSTGPQGEMAGWGAFREGASYQGGCRDYAHGEGSLLLIPWGTLEGKFHLSLSVLKVREQSL